jgi:hypothetical protein
MKIFKICLIVALFFGNLNAQFYIKKINASFFRESLDLKANSIGKNKHEFVSKWLNCNLYDYVAIEFEFEFPPKSSGRIYADFKATIDGGVNWTTYEYCSMDVEWYENEFLTKNKSIVIDNKITHMGKRNC